MKVSGSFKTLLKTLLSCIFFFLQADKHEVLLNLIQALKKSTLLEAIESHIRMESDLPEELLTQLLNSLKKLRFLSLSYKLGVSALISYFVMMERTTEATRAICTKGQSR